MTNRIINEDEKKSALVNDLVGHWISQTKDKPAKVQQLVDFLQQDKIQRVLPYNAEITDEIINAFSSEDGDQAQDTNSDSKPDQGKGGKAKIDPKQQQEYVARIKKVIDGLKPEEKTALARMLG